MGTLEGKVVVITGAATGIGRASAELMAREGASIVIGDVNEIDAAETTKLINEKGGEAIFVKTNVSDESDVENLVNIVVEKYGRLDCAFNNAGIEGALAPTSDHREADWNKVIDINLKGVFLCMKHQIRAMLGTGGGCVVNTASALGKVACPNMPAYVASKHGVIGVTRAAALEYSRHGVRINAIAPGVIETPMMRDRVFDQAPEAEEALLAMHPIGRFGRPEEIAEAVRWLCSDAATFVTGEVLSVDGGFVAF